jgi:hypothetical protein
MGISTNLRKSLAMLATVICAVLAPSVFAVSVDLGSAANYAVVGVGGTVSVQSDYEIYQSATVINGNVAEGPHTTLTHGIDATVIGRWDYDLTDANPSASGYTGNVTGGFHQLDLSSVAADARSASASAAALTATQTFASLDQFDGVGSINGTSGLNVIRVTGDSALKISLSLIGTPTSTFVFQFTSPTTAGHDVLSLSGMTMNIGTINPDNIFWDFNGAGGDLNINAMAAGQTVYGNFLAPDRNITADHAIVLGRLIGGGNGSSLSIHSSSQITNVPEPGVSSLLLVGIVFSGVILFRRLRIN